MAGPALPTTAASKPSGAITLATTRGTLSTPRPARFERSGTAVLAQVNEQIGSEGGGNTSEAAAAPFGMIEFGPQVADPYDTNFVPGQPIAGLSLTNVDGVGCPLFGDVPILPLSGSAGVHPGAVTSDFTTTSAAPGSWTGTVGSVQVSAAATTRTAIAALQFPPDKPAIVVVKAGDSANGNTGAVVRVASSTEVVGSASSGAFCGSPATYTLYFAFQSSVPFVATNTYQASGRGAGTVVSFGASESKLDVTIKVAISYVSIADAEANLVAEDPSWSVAAVQQKTESRWEQLLSQVQVTGGTPTQRAVLYTALYHSLLAPETFSDANGRYLGFDGRVHTLRAGETQYSEFSGWDIQVSEFPLLCLIVPRQAAEMAQSLVRDAEQGGWLPRWPVAASYTGVMEGDPADVILADAVAFGCTDGLDVLAAAQSVVKGATVAQTPSDLGQGTYWERYYGPDFNAHGFAPFSASETLQLAMDDYAGAQLASAAGLSSEAKVLLGYSGNWRNTFDAGIGLPEPRNYLPPSGDGRFQSSAAVGPLSQDNQPGFDEGNASQYTWLVPEHLDGLAAELGGDAPAASRLAHFLGPMTSRGLDATSQQPYYMASNETDLWAPWEGDFFGDPTLTARATSAAVRWFYGPSSAGLPGNDDAGEMSSWGLWAMVGLFPIVPGTATMAVGSPEFTSVVLGSGDHVLSLSAPNAGGSDIYVQATSFDGRGPLGRPSFSLPAVGSASLVLEMGSHPAGGAFSSSALADGSPR